MKLGAVSGFAFRVSGFGVSAVEFLGGRDPSARPDPRDPVYEIHLSDQLTVQWRGRRIRATPRPRRRWVLRNLGALARLLLEHTAGMVKGAQVKRGKGLRAGISFYERR